ncbi:MAG: DUF1800 domain-containing protein [Anaerolineae bacterium]|nr:DUF1800 domain-containing protein [Anaerolineae bacterium]
MQQFSRRDMLKLTGLAAVAASNVGWLAKVRAQEGTAQADPSWHVLSRVTWGPMAVDVERIQAIGAEAYIDWQLSPENIPDSGVDEWLSKFDYLAGTARGVYDRAYVDDYVYTVVPWQRIYRAAYSERQLFELMVEFWTDHFNIAAGDSMGEKIVDDREVIRRHALGNFRDLLFASAQSPAMLFYLNNAESVAEHPNENYAREVMELHTLGVNGGYTEADVRAVARALTGWTVADTANGAGSFYFDGSVHDYGEKQILGYVFPAGRGIEDGLQVLDILATHPSTARFIASKLARRFVSDQPPEDLVESAAQIFLNSGGDIRQTMRHILLSPQFAAAQGQKFRRPIDFMVAMLRALRPGLDFGNRPYLVWSLEDLGQLPYNWNPPNGYPDAAGAWLNTNGLLNRWNLALGFPYASEGWWDDISLNLNAVVPHAANANQLVANAVTAILGTPARLPREDFDLLSAFVADDGNPTIPLSEEARADKLPTLIGLLLASPQFQWH